MQQTGKLLRALMEHYGARIDVYTVDPRNPVALWDNIRYRVRPATPAWILGRKKIFEGVPDLAQLEEAIDAELNREPLKGASHVEEAQV